MYVSVDIFIKKEKANTTKTITIKIAYINAPPIGNTSVITKENKSIKDNLQVTYKYYKIFNIKCQVKEGDKNDI